MYFFFFSTASGFQGLTLAKEPGLSLKMVLIDTDRTI